jgi:hypothetical protein
MVTAVTAVGLVAAPAGELSSMVGLAAAATAIDTMTADRLMVLSQ